MNNFVEGNYEDKYNAGNPISQFLMTRFLTTFRLLLKTIKENNHISTICEIGCGEGELLKILREYFPHAEIFACDLSPNEIKKAKVNCKGLNIHFSVQDAQQLNYKDKQFDLLVACEVLEHIPEPNKTISEMQRIGKLAVVSMPIEPLWRVLNILRFKYLHDFGNTPGHLNHWSQRSFQKQLKLFHIFPLVMATPYPWQMYLVGLEPNFSREGQDHH
jgi:ubiquinone/menaquinone biosynthesis C-methylase UbiE